MLLFAANQLLFSVFVPVQAVFRMNMADHYRQTTDQIALAIEAGRFMLMDPNLIPAAGQFFCDLIAGRVMHMV
ncbi:MAG: hypothetical protein Q4D17_11690, partial [Planctomycetia bacterium]|nr:hypothetical protein [Planctomycetia bacterium]